MISKDRRILISSTDDDPDFYVFCPSADNVCWSDRTATATSISCPHPLLTCQLAVSKAALLASLSAPGETKAPAQLVASFETLLTSVTSHSSQRNVKVPSSYDLS